MNYNKYSILYESDSEESDYETYKNAKPLHRIYIRPVYSKHEIKDFIKETGVRITKYHIPTKNKKPRGFAFVSVATNEDVDKILGLDGNKLNDIKITVSVEKKK